MITDCVITAAEILRATAKLLCTRTRIQILKTNFELLTVVYPKFPTQYLLFGVVFKLGAHFESGCQWNISEIA